jgi:cobalamin biosynthesis protein CobW
MKIPVTIITGFLGSGKTTLLCNLLKQSPDLRLAILVNEFGEVSIDGALLRTASGNGAEIHDLPNGCICCTVQDGFLPIMKKLQARKDEIDHVLIETSGLALPTPVIQALNWPEVRNDFQLDAVITVVDTPQLLDGKLERGSETPGLEGAAPLDHENAVDFILNQQLENADVVVLNKVDELHEDQLLEAEKLVRAKSPRVRFLEVAYHAELDTRLCLGMGLHQEEAPQVHGHGHHDHHAEPHHGPVQLAPTDFTPLADQTQFNGHAHSGLKSHEHGEHSHEHFHEHDTGWQSFVLRSRDLQDHEKLKLAVREVSLKEPILRAKGFALIAGKHHRLVLQGVRSRVQAYYESEHTHEHESTMVFIGHHPNRQKIAALVSELSGTRWA